MRALLIILILMLSGCVAFQAEVLEAIPAAEVQEFEQVTDRLYALNRYGWDNQQAIEQATGDPLPLIALADIARHKETADLLARANAFLDRYEGKKLEGTGLDLSKPLGILTLAGGIVLIVLFPSVLVIALQVAKRARKALRAVVETLEQADKRESKAAIKDRLSKRMDHSDKLLVAKVKHYK